MRNSLDRMAKRASASKATIDYDSLGRRSLEASRAQRQVYVEIIKQGDLLRRAQIQTCDSDLESFSPVAVTSVAGKRPVSWRQMAIAEDSFCRACS